MLTIEKTSKGFQDSHHGMAWRVVEIRPDGFTVLGTFRYETNAIEAKERWEREAN